MQNSDVNATCHVLLWHRFVIVRGRLNRRIFFGDTGSEAKGRSLDGAWDPARRAEAMGRRPTAARESVVETGK